MVGVSYGFLKQEKNKSPALWVRAVLYWRNVRPPCCCKAPSFLQLRNPTFTCAVMEPRFNRFRGIC